MVNQQVNTCENSITLTWKHIGCGCGSNVCILGTLFPQFKCRVSRGRSSHPQLFVMPPLQAHGIFRCSKLYHCEYLLNRVLYQDSRKANFMRFLAASTHRKLTEPDPQWGSARAPVPCGQGWAPHPQTEQGSLCGEKCVHPQ